MATDGFVGRVRAVIAGRTDRASYLHVRTDGVLGQDRFVPVTHVKAVTGRTVWLRGARRDVEAAARRSRPSGARSATEGE
jgi:hypothetical protein